MKILLAEDDPTTRTLLELQLKRWGYEVVTAGDGREAWRVLQPDAAPPLALLDWMMPEMDGIDLCRTVRREKPEPYTYIILLSSLQKDEDIVAGLEAGADDYITKPFKSNELRVRLRAGSRIVELQRQLARHAADLEAANGELETFNYSASHDLRQPLNLICGYGQVIEAHCAGRLCDTCSNFLREIYHSCRRMSDLIEALLRFSRLSKGELRRAPVDLSRLAEAAVRELQAASPDRHVAVHVAAGATAEGDPDLLLAVMENLIGNAWKYTGSRDDARIEFGMEERNGERVYYVRDNGAGFHMADAGKLFVPFQRLPGAERFRGHGIGLATVYRIIKRHGGRIWAEGEPERGATFFFVL